jgi:hypothetical protein
MTIRNIIVDSATFEDTVPTHCCRDLNSSGWLCLFDPSTNKKYYWDQKNNVTTYEKPTAKEPASQVGVAVMAQRGCAG